MNLRRMAAGFLLAATFSFGQGPCGNAEDRLTYARERLASLPPGDAAKAGLEQIYRFLQASTRSCRNSGDLWYYLSVVEGRLGKPARDVEYSKKNATTLSSNALTQSANPFTDIQPGKVSEFVRTKWALVIGIGEFEDKTISKLRYTVKDAKDFAAALIDPEAGRFPEANVHLVLNEKATLQGIRDELAWLHSNAKPEDLVVIYISSHGSPSTLDAVASPLSYIITHDTKLDSLYARSYPMVDLVQQISRDIAASRVVLLLDACHSGSAVVPNTVRAASRSLVAEGAESANYSFAVLRNAVGRAVMMSSRAEETSWESEKLGNGYFTKFLIDGLRQKKGLAPLREVFSFVSENVSTRVQADLQKTQTPVFQAAQQGADIILGVAPK